MNAGSRIWVAGCGTNQAVITAQKFPNSSVYGSDLSASSIEIARSNAKQLGLKNLELHQESINQSQASAEFDYVICTGVIHHNADPSITLDHLAAALKTDGVLELMVYNRYHRMQTTAIQKALQLISGTELALDHQTNAAFARQIMDGFWLPGNNSPVIEVVGAEIFSVIGSDESLVEAFDRGERTKNAMAQLLSACQDVDEVSIADALFQPVEHSYTVKSLAALCQRSRLELVSPCLNQFDRIEQRISWNLQFANRAVQERYEALSDLDRWQVTNLLAQEQSPRLWFYVQHQECSRGRKTDKQLADEFLSMGLRAEASERIVYLKDRKSGDYVRTDKPVPFPGLPQDSLARKVVQELSSGQVLQDILDRLGVEATFSTVHQLRQLLCTSALPFVRAEESEKK